MAKSRNQRRKEARARQQERWRENEQRRVEAVLGEEIVSSIDVQAGPAPVEESIPPALVLPDQQTLNVEVIGAINRMAEAIGGLAEQVQQGFSQFDQRIATIEQAQQDGLLTVASQSGLNTLGLQGGGMDQSQLVQTREFHQLRQAEMQSLGVEGYDIPGPVDDRMVIVGAVTEEEAMRRRMMIQEELNRGGRF
jgi:hypothetical protein